MRFARVAAVKSDGKLDLSVKDKIPMQMDKDAEEILQRMVRSNSKSFSAHGQET